MTDREVMQQALEALEFANVNHWWGSLTIDKAIHALRTALEQQAEPDRWVIEKVGDKLLLNGKEIDPGTIEVRLDGLTYRSSEKMEVRQQAEPVAWDKPSAGFNDWWNGDYDDAANPFEKDSAAYWAWAGWKAGQAIAPPQCKPLTDEQLDDIAVVARRGNLHDLRIAIEAAHGIKEGT